MSECKEIWKDVKGYENIYRVSNFGNVKSLDRMIQNTKHKNFKKKQKGKMLKGWDNGNGYKMVTFSVSGKHRNKYIHRLVAEHFIGEIKPDQVINHIDFDKNNNHVDNLEIVTQLQNVTHSCSNDRMSRGKIKRSDGVVYNSMKKAAQANGVVISSMFSAVNRGHKCRGYYFEKVIK